jgi:hypothetical protein
VLIAAAGAAILAALVASATAGRQRHALRSGLYGHVSVGPLTPVCRVGTPCDGPAPANTKLLFARHGHVVARTRTKAGGAYRIALRPGWYTVRARIGMGVVKPPSVHVVRRRFIRVDLAVDTGIR